MKKIALLLMLLIILPSISSLESMESLEKRVNEFELQGELAEKIIDRNKAQGKDMYELRSLLKEYNKAVENFKTAVSLNNAETANRRMEDVWRVEVELKNEMKKFEGGEEKSSRDEMQETLEKAAFEREFIQASINEMKQKGVDVRELQKGLYELEEMYENVLRYHNQENDEIANLELQKAYRKKVELKNLLEGYGVKMGNENKKEKVENALTNMRYPLELTQVVIDKARKNDNGVTKIQNDLDEINGLFEEMAELYEKGNHNQAYNKLQRIFIVSVQLQKGLNKLYIPDDRTNRQKVEDALREYGNNRQVVQLTLNTMSRSGTEVVASQKILNQINIIIKDAKTLLPQGRSYESWKKIQQAVLLEKDFQKSFRQTIEEKKVTRKNLDKIINSHKKKAEHVLEKIEAYEAEGKDVTEAKKLLEEINGLINDAKEAYERKNEKKAWKNAYRAFILGNKLEKKFNNFKIDKERIFVIISDTKPNLLKAQKTITLMKDKGMDTRNVQEVFDEVNDKLKESEVAYNEEQYNDASKILREAMVFGKKLETLSEDLIEEYKK